MKIAYPFPQTPTITEAKMIQSQLRDQVSHRPLTQGVTTVAGVDVGFEDHYKVTKAAVVVLSFPDLQIVEQQIHRQKTVFPYVPGYLSFREIPPLLGAWEKLRQQPDLVLCDGQGYAHPRRFGLACHLGVLIDRPTIGVAKSPLVGEHQTLGEQKGDYQWLVDQGEVVGAVVRSRTGVKPLYVSVGHGITLEQAIAYVLACTPKYRLPETTRFADRLSKVRDD